MVDNILDLLTIEFMENGNSHGSVGEGGNEGHGPVG